MTQQRPSELPVCHARTSALCRALSVLSVRLWIKAFMFRIAWVLGLQRRQSPQSPYSHAVQPSSPALVQAVRLALRPLPTQREGYTSPG
jgi:hypothetical protein